MKRRGGRGKKGEKKRGLKAFIFSDTNDDTDSRRENALKGCKKGEKGEKKKIR